jgi:hypothetical protein
MAKRKLAFTDAVRLLGGDEGTIGWINELAGGAVAAVAVATVGDVDVLPCATTHLPQLVVTRGRGFVV